MRVARGCETDRASAVGGAGSTLFTVVGKLEEFLKRKHDVRAPPI